MSMKSWKKEFYPVPAKEVPEEEALDHSIQKWKGLQKDNLARHELIHDDDRLISDSDESNSLKIDSESCALCIHHAIGKGTCERCPLFLALGMSCDYGWHGESPYGIFVNGGNAKPMLAALLKAKKITKKKEDRS